VVGAARVKLGRKAKTTFIIIDAQSVKNTDILETEPEDAF
jgi:hypothetical protein